jgi:hypothetical protein
MPNVLRHFYLEADQGRPPHHMLTKVRAPHLDSSASSGSACSAVRSQLLRGLLSFPSFDKAGAAHFKRRYLLSPRAFLPVFGRVSQCSFLAE